MDGLRTSLSKYRGTASMGRRHCRLEHVKKKSLPLLMKSKDAIVHKPCRKLRCFRIVCLHNMVSKRGCQDVHCRLQGWPSERESGEDHFCEGSDPRKDRICSGWSTSCSREAPGVSPLLLEAVPLGHSAGYFTPCHGNDVCRYGSGFRVSGRLR
jgi:hypothetical protein